MFCFSIHNYPDNAFIFRKLLHVMWYVLYFPFHSWFKLVFFPGFCWINGIKGDKWENILTDFRLFILTFHINSATARQHHHIGWRAGWSWWFHCCSYGATGCCSAGGGAGGACIGVTYNHCKEKNNHVIKCPFYFNTALVAFEVILAYLLCFLFQLATEVRRFDWL